MSSFPYFSANPFYTNKLRYFGRGGKTQGFFPIATLLVVVFSSTTAQASGKCSELFGRYNAFTISYTQKNGTDRNKLRNFDFIISDKSQHTYECVDIKANWEGWNVTGEACNGFSFRAVKSGEGTITGWGSCEATKFTGDMGYVNRPIRYRVEIY